MLVSNKKLNRIIKEAVDRLVKEAEQIAVGGTDGWEDWATTDARNGLTPEEGKRLRMQARGINRSYDEVMAQKGNTVRKKYNVNPPSYNDWKNNFSNMPYMAYVEKRKNGEL